MVYIICPTCGYLLGTKQLIYETEMDKLCKKHNADYDMLSKGLLDNNKEFKDARKKIINSLCERYCCKMRMLTYIDVVPLIK